MSGSNSQRPNVDDSSSKQVDYDEFSGVGVQVTPWMTQDGTRRFIGLTFVSALSQESHDLTSAQATELAAVLATLA